MARTEREQIDVGDRVDRVAATAGQVDDAVAGADLRYPSLVPAQARAGQHIEDLLLAAVLVHGRRPAAGWDLDPPHADADGAGRLAKERPSPAQMAELERRAGGRVV